MKAKQPKTERWWRLSLLLIVCLFAGSSPTWADAWHFAGSSEHVVMHSPTLEKPYMHFVAMMYDKTANHNAFFTLQKPTSSVYASKIPSGAADCPAMFINGEYLCSPKDEFGWNYNGDGAWSACGSDNNGDSWWKNTYKRTINGVTYTVKFYNPYHQYVDGKQTKRIMVNVVIFADKLMPGTKYQVTIAGMWRMVGSDQNTPKEEAHTWTFTPIPSLNLSTPQAVMEDYHTMSVEGSLLAGYGPTEVGSHSKATTANLAWSDDLNSGSDEYPLNYNNNKYSSLKLTFDRQKPDETESKYVEYIIQRNNYSPEGFNELPDNAKANVKFYQWVETKVPGFIKATGLEVSYEDRWNKQMTLKWGVTGSNSNGTWNVYRYPGTDKSKRVLLKEKLAVGTRNCVVDVPTYDTPYTYEVAFMPANTPSQIERLTSSVVKTLARSWSFSLFTGDANEMGTEINLSWTHNTIDDASSSKTYELKIERATNVNGPWTTVKTQVISDKKVNSGNYTDTKDLLANTTYHYRLSISLLDDVIMSSVIDVSTGGTRVKTVTASRGTYSNMVKLKWEVQQVGDGTSVTDYVVQRRPLGSNDEKLWADIHTTSGTASSYTFDDVTAQPGSFNEYKVTAISKGSNNTTTHSMTADGFSLASGVVSGNITFGTGTAVEGAKVMLKQQSVDGEVSRGMYSVKLSGYGAGMRYASDNATLKSMLTNSFSLQMYLNPNDEVMSENNEDYVLFDVEWAITVSMKYDAANKRYKLTGYFAGQNSESQSLFIPAREWSHLTLVYDKAAQTLTAYLTKDDETQSEVMFTNVDWTDNWSKAEIADCFAIGNVGQFSQQHHFDGYVDEFRFFTRALSKADILKNYNHPLAGNEKGLAIYYPFDEGLTTQNLAYDFSKTNNVSNGRHAETLIPAQASDYIPSEDQLSLMAYTDETGAYQVRGIPFSGEGTTYSIIPQLGVHQFSPANRSRFFSMSSLVHSSVDFEDVSSFPVSGVVYYENTTIPVADAYLYVDGMMASKDSEPVMTNSKGEFTVSVPIGDHFVQVKKEGHTFVNGGRYPNDPSGIGIRENFDDAIDGLTFYDNTLVTVAGRVAGGDIEYEKPLGLGLSNANIGKAKLNLKLSNSNGFLNYDRLTNAESTEQRNFDTQYGLAYVLVGQNYITVETDPATGEWVAQLPPLRYDVTWVGIDSNDEITKDNFSLPVIDATNPNVTYTDSIEADGQWKRFKYVASAKMEYKSESTIEVTENGDGSFGMETYTVKDISNKEHEVKLYTVDANGNVSYTFGYPIYQELSSYKYNIYAYERYVNKDSGKDVVDEVPLAGKEVTIKNQYAKTTSVSKENGAVGTMVDDKLELNDEGKAQYLFTVGLPNIQEPYTRGLSVSYDNNGTEMQWSGNNSFKVIVLGGLPTGNNFVTEGPDKVLMILRDPPGSNSQTTWSKGTTVTRTTTTTTEYNNETGVNATIYAGVKTADAQGIGFMVITELESKCNIKAGAEYTATRTSGNTTVHTTTTTRDISTSDAMDFVGACGDVFIGSSTNLIFGVCRTVDIQWDNATGTAKLVQDDAMSMGEQFDTDFAYDQNYIKEVLIPNFESARNQLLTKVSDVSTVSRPAEGEKTIYVTTLDEDDPKYGTSNDDKVWGNQAVSFDNLDSATGIYRGPSYTMILPVNYGDSQDMVNYYNTQIKKWETQLANNEEAKVKAMEESKWFKQNRSFSAGAGITESVTTEDTGTTTKSQVDGFNIVLGLETGYRFAGIGLGVEVEEKNGGSWTSEEQKDSTTTATMAYTLQEDGDDDYLSVDIYNAPDGYGPIFVTRAGATSCPYEDKVVTEYYKPGTIISHKTVQIEKPEIEAQTQLITGVPAGGSANFKVNIRNNSDTGEDLWFDLLVAPDSNPDGLAVSMDDTSLNYGTTVLVKAGETMEKTITVSQTNPDVLKYENVKLRIASQCQKDNTSTYKEIADTTEFSVFFQPSCSDIKLASSHTLVNTETQSAVTLSMSGYNYSMASLKGIRLEYKGEHDADFRTLQEYSKDEARVASDHNLRLLPALEGNKKLDFTFDLRSDDYADKTYVFRAVTVCDQGGVEVNNESDEVVIIRDMSFPKLIALPSPATGILTSADDLVVTFNEDIQSSSLTEVNNFEVVGVLNESEVLHDVALSLSGQNAAKTEATVDLAGKSFAANMWVNYSEDGRLLMHGTADNNFSVTIENGKLVVSVAGKRTESGVVLPKNKWLYLNVSYNAGDGDFTLPTVSAGYAMGSDEVKLFDAVATKAYSGNGSISVGGENLVAKVQELSLWNSARSLSEAEADMYTTKNQYTSGLIGYWQLNEGHGSVASDKARNRHITLPGENAWWINGDNYAMVLDGTKAATINIGSLNTTGSDDYLIETWFKADKQQNGVASILGTMKMDLRLNAEGKLEMLLGNTADPNNTSVTPVGNKDLRDGLWHHLAVNVLKSTNGSGSIYIDGQLAKQVSASTMPILYGDKLTLGGRRVEVGVEYNYLQLLKGAIDEVRIWKGRRTADVIKNNMYVRMEADKAGLIAYYPMEKTTKDEYNLIVSTGTFEGQSAGNAEELGFYGTDGASLGTQLSALNTQSTAALKPAPKFENVKFSFVASERQIKVNLDELPAKIEGCNLFITVKNIRDLNGNKAEAITWSVYVQRNSLKWQKSELDVTKSGAERATFTATIENNGSESEAWSLSGMPTWLSANAETGTLMPLSTGTLTFAVDESLPIGTHEATIYLTSSKNIVAPLYVTVKSQGQVPSWSVNPSAYENSMNVIGRVELDGMPMNDEDDIVAAFIGDECRGVAHLEYKESFDGYYVTMDIYGNSDSNKEVTFRAYDASTGTIYPAVQPDVDIKFEPLVLKGTYASPVVLTVLDKIEQSTDLKTGWNWLSLNVVADDMSTESVFEKIADDVLIVKSQSNGWLMYENGQWNGSLDVNLSNTQMYAVKMQNDRNLHVIGHRVDPSSSLITLGKNWNWIGYYGRQLSSVGDAFASMNPVSNDILKAQSGVAYYDGIQWQGSIRVMEPGKGYMLNNTSGSAKQFGYPSATLVGARELQTFDALSPETGDDSQTGAFNPVDLHKYSGNAIMTLKVVAGEMVIGHAEVGVFAADECRTASQTNGDGVAFLTIPGDDDVTLTFKVAVGDQVLDAMTTVNYEVDGVYGSPANPLIIDLGEVTGIWEILNGNGDETIYDLSGRKLDGRQLRKGVYIVNGQKKTVK